MKTINGLMACLVVMALSITNLPADDEKKADETPKTSAKSVEKVTPVLKPAEKPAEPASDVLVDGVEPGKFTQDIDAAKAYAKENNLPIFINITGSDWCSICKIMDANVFSKPEWKAYAKENWVLVFIDFPKKNKDLVPEKYRERNKTLYKEYEAKGYPTYVLLTSDGKVIDKAGGTVFDNPATFRLRLEKAMLSLDSKMKALCETLKPEDSEKVLSLHEETKVLKAKEVELKNQLAECNKKLDETSKAIGASIKEAKLATMSELKKAEYDVAVDAHLVAKGKYEAWVKKYTEWAKANNGRKVTKDEQKDIKAEEKELKKEQRTLMGEVYKAEMKVDELLYFSQ